MAQFVQGVRQGVETVDVTTITPGALMANKACWTVFIHAWWVAVSSGRLVSIPSLMERTYTTLIFRCEHGTKAACSKATEMLTLVTMLLQGLVWCGGKWIAGD